MAIEKVLKIRVLGFKEIEEDCIKKLQDLEIVHLENPSPKDISLQDMEKLKDVEKVLNFLHLYEEKSIVQDFFKEKIFLKKDEFKKIDFEGLLRVIQDILELSLRREELLSRRRILIEKLERISKFLFLDANLSDLKSLRYYIPIFITLNPREEARLKALLKDKDFFFWRIKSNDGRDIFSLWIRKEEEKILLDILRRERLDIWQIPWDLLTIFKENTPSQIVNILNTELAFIDEEIEKIKKEAKRLLSYKYRLMIFYDYLLNENFSQSVGASIPKTQRFFILEGWILEKNRGKMLEMVEGFKERVFLDLRPPLKTERPPTKLKNKKIFEPFQILVNMYGAPHPDSLDPTVFLSPFFFLFVGICISDAGYGMVLSLLSLYILKKRRLSKGGRDFVKLLFYLGLSTFLVGMFLGSLWGISLPFKLIDILNSPFQFLLFCFFLGFLQVMVGISLRIFTAFKNKNYHQAISCISWIILLLSLPLFFFSKISLFKFLGLFSIGGILFFSSGSKNLFLRLGVGLYELYGITKYFSDILSYARLLALGMATGVIAMVVNILAKLAFGIPVLGIFLSAGVLLAGHLFNIFINLISGFIHSARLQFVEFFSKFFDLGGRFFEPLRPRTKYIYLENTRR